jgi:hypothetical protein
LINSAIAEGELLKLNIKASYKPSEKERKLRNLELNSEIPKRSKSFSVIIGVSDEESD